MSRSRRQPYAKESYGSSGSKAAKRTAAKAVRKSPQPESRPKAAGQYKKLYNSWNICDYRFYVPNNYRFRRK